MDVNGYGVSCFPEMRQGINLLHQLAEQSHGCTCMTYEHLDASARQEMLREFAGHIWLFLIH